MEGIVKAGLTESKNRVYKKDIRQIIRISFFRLLMFKRLGDWIINRLLE
ncbi:hypothetical protein Ccel_2555 [Ruminiclostridium cellulolyticum H10]|uniref:Uncharacterized protein n=1 Tax=Ruminiclostridium cellulolyticum (strain ATCC 35319 / DSM 5812 / JCM 6584 / H10) TaxID=394503 RepID=B8I6B8_RUMCH|nr:hypothetical protein Ccel_2555 [Ruminiclostridium cellulolyticum H10]